MSSQMCSPYDSYFVCFVVLCVFVCSVLFFAWGMLGPGAASLGAWEGYIYKWECVFCQNCFLYDSYFVFLLFFVFVFLMCVVWKQEGSTVFGFNDTVKLLKTAHQQIIQNSTIETSNSVAAVNINPPQENDLCSLLT